MKKTTFISIFTAVLLCFCGCSNDDDSDLSGVERSLVGCWQVVEHYNYSHQEPIEGIQVIVFKSDRTQSVYKDGQLQYETQYWAKPVKDYDGYYLYHQPDEDYSQSTYSCTFEVAGNQLTIWESGCFNVSKTVYQRIPSLNEANPEVGAYKYEDNPTILEGTWHLAQANFSFGGIHEFATGEVTVYFNTNHTMQVINKQKTMQEIITDTEFGIKFIAGANGFSKIANLTVDELDYFAKQFSMLGNADIIIIDTGAGIANNVLQFVAAADEVYVVTTPEPTAITDAYGIIKIITTELVDRETNIKLLVNRVHSADEGKRISERIINIAAQFLNYKVDYIGFVYDDPVVQASVIRQKPFIVVNPTSKPAQCIKHIVGRIEKSDNGNSEGVTSFLKKFLRKN